MKTRFFYAPEAFNTWPKLFVLSEDGRFYCEYLDYMKPAKVDETQNFETFRAEDYKWNGYQTIIEISESEAKSKVLISQVNWIRIYLSRLQ